MRSRFWLLTSLLILGLLALAPAPAALAQGDPGGLPSGDGVDPVYIVGNPSCATLNANPAFPGITKDYGFKINQSAVGQYLLTSPPGTLEGGAPSDPNNWVEITASDGVYFNWAASLGIDAVIVKGGNNANAFVYVPEDTADTQLHAPINPSNGQPFGISHIEFCYDYGDFVPLTATKTAAGTYDRTVTWTLEKSVAPASHSGAAGQTAGTSTWTVVATKNETLGNYKVQGTITVNNANSVPVNFSISDSLNDGTAAAVSCPSNTVPAGGSVTCTYTASPAGDSATLNTATVTSNTAGVGGASATASVSFTANVIGDDTVTVDDDRDTEGQFPASISATTTFDYDETFDCSGNTGDYTNGVDTDTYPNTATATGPNTNLSADAEVIVTCTLQALVPSKTAAGTYDRTVTWTLEKSVAPAEYNGHAGDVFESTWTVVATKNETLGNYKVVGSITIQNPDAVPQDFTVSDMMNDGTAAAVTCPGTLNDTGTVPAATGGVNGSITCNYVALPNSKNATLNTATVKMEGKPDQLATAAVVWTEQLSGYDSGVLSDQRFAGPPWNYGGEVISSSTTRTFKETFACPIEPSAYIEGFYINTQLNTAKLNGNLNLEASASVNLTCRLAGLITVTKIVNWNGSTPVQGKTFSICVTGPTYPSGSCQIVDYDGGVVTWTNLAPGQYTVTEVDPGVEWNVQVAGSPLTVPAAGGVAATVTNTKLPPTRITVTKVVTETALQQWTFVLRLDGGDPKTVTKDQPTATWDNLAPNRSYVLSEDESGEGWVEGPFDCKVNGASVGEPLPDGEFELSVVPGDDVVCLKYNADISGTDLDPIAEPGGVFGLFLPAITH